MASYYLLWAKAWYSLEKESTQHGPKPEFIVCSYLEVKQLFFHTCDNCGAQITNSGL